MDGKKGDVVQTDYIPATDSPTPAPSVEGLGELTGEEAKQVALSDAQVTEDEVINLRVETDYDDHDGTCSHYPDSYIIYIFHFDQRAGKFGQLVG